MGAKEILETQVGTPNPARGKIFGGQPELRPHRDERRAEEGWWRQRGDHGPAPTDEVAVLRGWGGCHLLGRQSEFGNECGDGWVGREQ